MALHRTFAILILILGLAAAAVHHSTGALGTRDALVAATLHEGIAGSPPLPLTSRVLAACVHAVRLIQPGAGIFHAMHLGAGVLLAVAAVLSGLVAHQAARGLIAAGAAASLFVATAMLFGADTARFAMSGGPAITVLLLLSGAGWAWTRDKPWPLLGGLLLGLGIAEHPLCLLLAPGFAMLARDMCQRGARAKDREVLLRIGIGVLVGLTAWLVPLKGSAGQPLLDHGNPETFGRAIALWWGEPGVSFYRLQSPGAWLGGFLGLWAALWKNVGPIGILLGLAGILLSLRGRGQLAKPFLVMHAVPALALILGDARDAFLLRILVAWPFLFLALPTLSRLARLTTGPEKNEQGHRRAAFVLPGLALLSGLVLFVANREMIDRSSERGIAWARDSFEILPKGALLLTGNPVHLTLAADGEREDVDVVYVREPTTLLAARGDREIRCPALPPQGTLGGGYLSEVVALNRDSRPVFIDPGVFFQPQLRAALLETRWELLPFGLAFEVRTISEKPSKDHSLRCSEIWSAYELNPDTPGSSLRDELTGNDFYARGLLQSAATHLDLKLYEDAEREFLFALSLEDANETLAAYGFARVLFAGKNYPEAARVLTEHTNDQSPGAWSARRLLGNTLLRLEEHEDALRELRRAAQLVPAHLPQEKKSLEALIQNVERRPGRRSSS